MDEQSAPFRPRSYDYVLALGALFVFWQVMTRGGAASLAVFWPEIATYFNGADAAALASLADVGFANARKAARDQKNGDGKRLGAKSEQIRTWAELAVRNDPLNARALYVLGRLALSDGDESRAAKLMAAAARRSLRESRAVHWLFAYSFGRRDFGSTAYYVDVLLRGRPELAGEVTPVLARMLENKAGSGELIGVLASNPPWRPDFFSHLNGAISDVRAPLDLLTALKDSPFPPIAADLRGYLNFLIQKRFFDLAYYVWLQFLPTEQLSAAGFLFNGNFQITPSGLPFDWVISSGAGVMIDIVAPSEEDGKKGLYIEFGYGRVDFRPVTQMVVLAPGAYRFKGEYRGEIVGRRGLEWRIVCAGEKREVIGESGMMFGAVSDWTPFEFDFTAPPDGCPAQYVSLSLAARSASEQLVSGSMWYGGLEIEPRKEAGNPD